MSRIDTKWGIFLSITLIHFLCSFGLFAENKTRVFHSVNDLYGVALNETNSVCKDRQGFIWVSSKTGILRLTDDSAQKYLLPYITANIVSVKLVCNDSVLIAYSNNGQFFEYDALQDEFDFVFDIRSFLKNRNLTIRHVLMDRDGVLFISSNLGLYRYKNKALALLTAQAYETYALDWYGNDRIFVSRSDGIWLLDIETQNIQHVVKNEEVVPFEVSSLFYDPMAQKLWIGTKSNGLFLYDLKKRFFSPAQIPRIINNPILDIEPGIDGTIFLGIDGQGLWELNRSGSRVLNVFLANENNPSSLQGNGVYDVFNDNAGKIWVCSYSGGASFFENSSQIVTKIRHKINESNSLVNNYVNDICEDRQGCIWFATNNGISKWNRNVNRWQTFFYSEADEINVFLSIAEASDGRIWAGTYSNGVYVLDEGSGQQVAHYSSRNGQTGKVGDFIFDIFEASENDLWIVGMLEDVVRYCAVDKTFNVYSPLPAYVIEDFTNEFKLVGCTNGLVLLNSGNGETETLLDGYIVYDILVQDSVIWCATSGEGLIRYDYKTRDFVKYTVKDGLPSNFVNSIIEYDGIFWLGTESGLCRFMPEDEKVLTFSSDFSLSRISFNRGAAINLQNGDLLFGTNNGAVMFKPSELETSKLTGRIYLQNLFICGKSIRDSSVYNLHTPLNDLQKLTLSYKQNAIRLDFLPLGITSSESKFSWKFEGVDGYWTNPSRSRTLTYASLPGGQFQLKIRLYDNSHTQIIDERVLMIIITPPFWSTWWFYLIVVCVIVIILYFIFKYHLNLMKQLHSEEKNHFFAVAAHGIRTSLTLISESVEEIDRETEFSVKGDYYLNLAKEQMDHLLKVTTQLLDFQKFDKRKGQLHLQKIDIVEFVIQRMNMFESYAQREGVDLIFKCDANQCYSAVDVGMMERVMDNLISNAIKYSHSKGKVYLKLACEKRKWTFEVEDQGIGISVKDQRQLFKEFYRCKNTVNSEIVGSGIGLLIVKNYVEIHGGSVSFNSEETVGSKFRIEMPIKELENDSGESQVAVSSILESEQNPVSIKITDSAKATKLRILVVEDNEKLRRFLEVSLSDDYIVLTANDGAEAG